MDMQQPTPDSPEVESAPTVNPGLRHVAIGLVVAIVLLASLLVALLVRGDSDQQDQSIQAPALHETEQPQTSTFSNAVQDPNVLLIILDDIGLDYFPGFLDGQGFDKASMPVIESLMEQSHVFHNLHTYAMCSPTRASLLTGLHGVETGVLDPGRTAYLDPRFTSVQQEIKSLSNDEIATSVFGKWHIIGRDGGLDHPSEFAIDHYAGIIEGNHDDYSNWTKTTNGVQGQSTTYSTTEFTNDAIDWISDQDGQWFTWLAYTTPHTPIHLPPNDLHTYDLSGEERDIRRNGEEYFKAMLQSVDTEIGRLLDSMDQQTRDSTYVAIVGDNGTGGNIVQEPYKSVGVKGTLQTGGINTPMIVYSPAHSGRHDHTQLISTIDFYPTIVDMFGLTQQTERPGNSFYSLITDQESIYAPHDFVYSQNTEDVTIISDGYKLLQKENGEELFYDKATDPFEQNALTSLNQEQEEALQRHKSILSSYLDGNY